jgi:hypothetical protein
VRVQPPSAGPPPPIRALHRPPAPPLLADSTRAQGSAPARVSAVRKFWPPPAAAARRHSSRGVHSVVLSPQLLFFDRIRAVLRISPKSFPSMHCFTPIMGSLSTVQP